MLHSDAWQFLYKYKTIHSPITLGLHPTHLRSLKTEESGVNNGLVDGGAYVWSKALKWPYAAGSRQDIAAVFTSEGAVGVVQLLSCVQIFTTPWIAVCQASLSFTISWSLLKLKSTESVMQSNDLVLCHPLLLMPSIFPSIGVFSNESVLCIRWPKYLSFSFSISPSNEYSRLMSFRTDWFDPLAVQGTLKSLFQHHCSKNWIKNNS